MPMSLSPVTGIVSAASASASASVAAAAAILAEGLITQPNQVVVWGGRRGIFWEFTQGIGWL